KKYGKEKFECIPLCYFDTYEEAVLEEEFLVTKEYCKLKDNYNIVEGGNNPIMYGADNPSWKGGVTELEKIERKNRKNIPRNLSGANNPMYGKTLSKESLQKICNTKSKKGLFIEVIVEGVKYISVESCAKVFNIHPTTVM